MSDRMVTSAFSGSVHFFDCCIVGAPMEWRSGQPLQCFVCLWPVPRALARSACTPWFVGPAAWLLLRLYCLLAMLCVVILCRMGCCMVCPHIVSVIGHLIPQQLHMEKWLFKGGCGLCCSSAVFQKDICVVDLRWACIFHITLQSLEFIAEMRIHAEMKIAGKRYFPCENKLTSILFFVKQSVGVAESMEITNWTNASWLPAKSIVERWWRYQYCSRGGSIRLVLIGQKSL